jgi:transposase-like protein
MTALGPVADCPSCATAAAPYRAEPDPGGMRAHYRCARCGRKWYTGWLLSPAEMAMFGSAA